MNKEQKEMKKLQKTQRIEQKRVDKATRLEARRSAKEQKKQNKALQKQQKKTKKLYDSAIARRRKQREQYKNSTQYKLYQLAKKQLNKSIDWYKLDNDALLYPMIATSEGRSNFRLSVQLKERVQPFVLQEAVNDIFNRFPTMTGCVKWGFFWPYIDKPLYPIVVTQRSQLPCRPMNIDNKHSQVRVMYYNNAISVEFFHSATDGSGGVIFFNTLLTRYFERLGYNVQRTENCLEYRDKPKFEELADNIPKIVDRSAIGKAPKTVKARKIVGQKLQDNDFIPYRGICDASQLKSVAKSMGATVNQLLCAAALIALNKYSEVVCPKDKRPIVLMVPVNLRKIFSMHTLRNFTNYLTFTYHNQQTLQEVVEDIKSQEQQQLNKENFVSIVSQNYFSAHHPLLKAVPLGIKKLAIQAVCSQRGGGVINSSTFSNLGVVTAPEMFKEHIFRYEFQLGQESLPSLSFSCSTFNNVCTIVVTNGNKDSLCPQFFYRTLSEAGIDLAIETELIEEQK